MAATVSGKNGSMRSKTNWQPGMILIETDSWLYGEDGCLILRTLEWKRNGHMYNMPKMILLATNISSAEFDNAKAAGFLLWRVQVSSPLSVVHYRNLDMLLRVNAGFLTPGFMELYVVFLCWSAVRSEPPEARCMKKAEAATKGDWLSIIVIMNFSYIVANKPKNS